VKLTNYVTTTAFEENTWNQNKTIKKKKNIYVSDWLFVSETPRMRFCQVSFFISETQQKQEQGGAVFFVSSFVQRFQKTERLKRSAFFGACICTCSREFRFRFLSIKDKPKKKIKFFLFKKPLLFVQRLTARFPLVTPSTTSLEVLG
jgi:hypothetical protein